ncbi:PREDICTED: transmembrane protein 109 [Gekko japonicus]|uniref:Transmembrane protein 109 n=1 Tax=Gekko japonicus TaxID=146911 RepID=A0ABM1JZI3_GEKJA|nr:PREDICTED: transmembrane protein 109 [Gekko japonicus]
MPVVFAGPAGPRGRTSVLKAGGGIDKNGAINRPQLPSNSQFFTPNPTGYSREETAAQSAQKHRWQPEEDEPAIFHARLLAGGSRLGDLASSLGSLAGAILGAMETAGGCLSTSPTLVQPAQGAAQTGTGEMSRRNSLLQCSHRLLLRPTFTILVLLAVFHVSLTNGQHHQREPWREKNVPPDFLSRVTRAMREALEDLLGPEYFLILNEHVSSLFWVLSSGISAGLFAVARIAGQFLPSFGIDGDHATQFLKLSPHQVQTLLLWGLAALIGYWVLSLLLNLMLAILSHIMWGLKVLIFMSCFMFIVSMVPDRSVQVSLLLALLMLYALLGRLSGSHLSGARLEAKVRGLERQVDELQRRQRRSSPKHLDEE